MTTRLLSILFIPLLSCFADAAEPEPLSHRDMNKLLGLDLWQTLQIETVPRRGKPVIYV